jgi:hypothetical protein
MAFASIVIAAGRKERLKTFASYAAILSLLWGMFILGAGAYYAYYEPVNPSRVVAALDGARAGFVSTGGATSLVGGASDDVPSMPFGSANMAANSWATRAARTLRGCAVMFVPITILRALSLVSFTGGRGLLLITDLDTLVMDAGIIASLLLLLRNNRQPTAVTIFALVLAALTIVSMAYVVTNYGTLFRLRLLAVTPMWVLPVFVGLPGGAQFSGRARAQMTRTVAS